MVPELASVEAFADYLISDERSKFTFEEATELATALGQSNPSAVIRELRTYGLRMEERPVERHVRGFKSNSHDRWFGPGSSPTHGGSGHEQINGFAGQRG